MTHRSRTASGFLGACAVLALASAGAVSATTSPPSTEPMGSEPIGSAPVATDAVVSAPAGSEPLGVMTASGPLCAALPMAGDASGVGMADDPVGTAASSIPLLSTLVTAISAAGLEDTLNGEGPFTVFAPINSAFDKLDQDMVGDLLADPDALTPILTYHVVPEQLSGNDLIAGGTFTTVNGADLTVEQVNQTFVINGGAAAVQCADVQTANATVFLIDTVLLPPADGGAETTEAVATSAVETTVPVTEPEPTADTTAPAPETTAVESTIAETTVVDTTVAPETTAAD